MTSTPITESDVTQGATDSPLSVREKIGYGLGDAGGTVMTCLIMNFLTFFYTDVFGPPRHLSVRCLSPCASLMPFPTR